MSVPIIVFLPACSAARLRPNPSFRLPGESIPCRPALALSAPSGERRSPALDTTTFLRSPIELEVPVLRHRDDSHATTHGRGTVAVRLLRFLIAPAATATRQRASRTRSHLCVYPRSAALPATFVPAVPPRHRKESTVRGHSAGERATDRHDTLRRAGAKTAFNLHRTRPPQTPAASF